MTSELQTVTSELQSSLNLPPIDAHEAWVLLGRLATGIFVFLVILLVARLLRGLATGAMERRSLRPDAVLLVSRSLYAVLVGMGVFLFFSLVLGDATVGITGFLIAAISTGLGLQDLFKNYVSGFYVLMEHNFRVGDLVEVGGYRGVVTDVRMRVTYLRGARGEMIVVPNSELFTKTVAVSPEPDDWGPASDDEAAARRASAAESAEHDPDQGVEIVPG